MEKKDETQASAPHEAPAKSSPPPIPAGPPPKRHVWPWIVAALIVLLIIGLAILRRHPQSEAGGGRGGRGGGEQVIPIDTVAAKKGDIGVYVNALGTVTPFYTVSVRSRVDGQLIKVFFKEGQLVHEGEPLAEIDPAPFEAALDQAQGQLARDNALLENARLDLSRYQEAYSQNAIPKQQLDTQGATVHQYEGTVKLDQATVTNAQVQLAYCHITAPITGRVGLRLVDPGNIVHATDTSPLIVITEMQPIAVIFSVAEDYLPQIQHQLKQGNKLMVDAFDRSAEQKIASGVLETLNNQIDTNTGTVQLKAIFTNEDETLFPNQFVNARLLVDTHRGVTLLPKEIIQHNAQGAYVYLVQSNGTNQTVTMKSVDVVLTEGDNSEIQGIDEGSMAAAANFNRLTDGAKVTMRTAGKKGQQGEESTNSPAGGNTNSPSSSGKGTNSPSGNRKRHAGG